MPQMLLVTPHAICIHCTAGTWDGELRPALEDDSTAAEGLRIEAHVPPPSMGGDAAVDFKLEACRAMLDRAAQDAAFVLDGAGAQPLATAHKSPLLSVALLHAPSRPLPTAVPEGSGAKASAQRLLALALRSVDSRATGGAGWVARGASALAAGWVGLIGKLERISDAYDRMEVSVSTG